MKKHILLFAIFLFLIGIEVKASEFSLIPSNDTQNFTYFIKSEIEYDDFGNIIESQDYYITEKEYESVNETEISPLYASDGTVTHETTYKKLTVTTMQTSFNTVRHTTILTWKKLPATRSYDFIAHRFEGDVTVFNPSATMTYFTDNGIQTIKTVSANSNSHLFKNFGNGWVAVFNLPEGNVSSLTVTSSQDFYVGGASKIYSTYQHSQKATTYQNIINTAKISSSGLGGVLSVGNVIQQNFDQMKGVNISINQDSNF